MQRHFPPIELLVLKDSCTLIMCIALTILGSTFRAGWCVPLKRWPKPGPGRLFISWSHFCEPIKWRCTTCTIVLAQGCQWGNIGKHPTQCPWVCIAFSLPHSNPKGDTQVNRKQCSKCRFFFLKILYSFDHIRLMATQHTWVVCDFFGGTREEWKREWRLMTLMFLDYPRPSLSDPVQLVWMSTGLVILNRQALVSQTQHFTSSSCIATLWA